MKRVYYLHLIEGRPAWFSKVDGQIVFMEDDRWKDPVGAQTLRRSVAEIRRDQRIARRNRARWGMKVEPGRYGFAIVRLPR